MKTVIFETENWERGAFDRLADDFELVFVEEPLDDESVRDFADAEVISTFIYSRLGRQVLSRMPQLRMIATRSTGYDHIDQGYCREQGIVVSNVPSYGEHTVAEHVFALLLTISHRTCEAMDRTRKGDFSLAGLRGFDLQGKTMGVLGTGAIGRHVVRIARGFDMQVLAYDVQPDHELADQMGFEYGSLDEVLEQSDVISLHVPANERTQGMISYRQFAAMKDGVVLINTARGNVVDVRALIQALSSGKVAAAGLDVLPEEPTIREEAELLHSLFHDESSWGTLLADHLLLRLRNVYITPHSAFNTREAVQRILDVTVENILAFRDSRPLHQVFDSPTAAAQH